MPADEVERVKKVKKLASEISAPKRKGMDRSIVLCLFVLTSSLAAEEPSDTVSKKLKAPKPAKTEAPKPKAVNGAALDEPSVKKGREILSKKAKSSKDVIANEKKIKDGNDSKLPEKKGLEPEGKISLENNNSDSSDDDTSDNEEVDDQTEALLKGFESDEDEGEDEQVIAKNGYESGAPIPNINKKAKRQAKLAGESSTSTAPGVVYLGRIPHGFYEHEMRQYFGQFGDILRLRLSRNRKTGTSKHFAFIEFKSNEVAEIVVKTMDNYLLFGHILKCKLVNAEQVHTNLWKGANKRFKKVPWNKIEGRKLEQGMTELSWDKRTAKEEKRRNEKAEKLKELGYEFKSPKLKTAKDVSKKQQQTLPAVEVDASVDSKAVESSLVLADSGLSKKKKKAKKAVSDENGNNIPTAAAITLTDEQPDVSVEDVAEEADEKKKTKKRGRSKKSIEGSGEAMTVTDIDVSTLKGFEEKTDQEKPKKAKKVKNSKIAEI